MNAVKKVLKAREMTALLFLAALFVVVGIINPAFLADSKNVANCFNDSVVYILIAVAMAFAIFIGEIDVSVGSNLGLVAAVVGTMLQDGKNWFLAFFIGILMGTVVGLINGWGVAVMKIPSLIFTLGTNGILRGLMYLQVGTKQVTDLPIGFKGASSYALFGLPLTGRDLSMLSLVSIIMLAGTVVNSSIILIEYIKVRRDKGEDRRTAILNACPLRVRPILMTSASTILGLLPLTVASGEGAQGRIAMGIAVVGGMVVSTLLTLYIVPAIYSYVSTDRIRKTKKNAK